MNGKYGSWRIQDGTVSRMIDGQLVELSINPVGDGTAIAMYGDMPEQIKTVLMGMCLFDARWQVQFEKPSGKNGQNAPPARRSLALPHDRQQAYDRILQGKKVEYIFVPSTPGVYHQKLLVYQSRSLRDLQPERVLYHLPVLEYLSSICELEQVLGMPLPELRAALSRFADIMLGRIMEELCFLGDRLEFISPMSDAGILDPGESYLHPYTYFDQYKIDPNSVVGVEDLVELRLSHTAQSRTGVQIPMQCLIMDATNPYTDKTLRQGEFESINL